MKVPSLRPLSIGEVLDVGLKIWWRNLWTLVRVVVLIVLPVQVLVALVNISLPRNGSGSAAAFLGGTLSVTLLSWIASTLATAACFKAIADAYLGERAWWRGSLAFAARRVHSVLWVDAAGARWRGARLRRADRPGDLPDGCLVGCGAGVAARRCARTEGVAALTAARFRSLVAGARGGEHASSRGVS